MSADNGIYVLKTKDGQYRVTHAQAIEDIYESEVGRNHTYNPLNIILTWDNCQYTRNFEIAMKIANSMERYWQTEYGIRFFTYNKTWKHLVEDAKKRAKEELENTQG